MINIYADIVGSLLRPASLISARDDKSAGRIDEAEFRALEDAAVDAAVTMQEEVGLLVISDGEMRRLSFQAQMVEAVHGFGRWDINAFLWGDWRDHNGVLQHRARPNDIGVTDKLSPHRYLSVDEFTYLASRTDRVPKVTLPSPSLFANFWSSELSAQAYPSIGEFLSDVADILCREVEELARRGAAYIQIDAPHYPMLLDATVREFYEAQGWSVEEWLELGIALDNRVIAAAPGVTFGFHLCRGNQGSRWLVEGDYAPIAEPIFRSINAQRLLLEYDDERSGGFEPLAIVPDDKTVVLGLVSTKQGHLESVAELQARVDEASKYFPRDQLAVSPQCGFGTSVLGNALTEAEQRAKLQRVVDVATEVWGPDAC